MHNQAKKGDFRISNIKCICKRLHFILSQTAHYLELSVSSELWSVL